MTSYFDRIMCVLVTFQERGHHVLLIIKSTPLINVRLLTDLSLGYIWVWQIPKLYLLWYISAAYQACLVSPWVFLLNCISPKYECWLHQTCLPLNKVCQKDRIKY